MSERQGVAVRIRGREFRIRSDEDPEALQRIAEYVDSTMSRVEERTGTVDSLDLAILTCLNLARELVELRSDAARIGDARLRSLIDRVEATVEATA